MLPFALSIIGFYSGTKRGLSWYGLKVMSSGTSVPLLRRPAPHIGAIPTLIRPMHTENRFRIRWGEAGNTFLQQSPQQSGENHVDEVMCHLQGVVEEGTIVRLGALPVRMGVAGLPR